MKPSTALSLEAAPNWATACRFALKKALPAAVKGRARFLIADDSTFMRCSVARLIGLENALEVVGEAVNGKDAVTLARSLRPDIIVMDVNMPLMDGIEATALIMAERPDILVVGFSSSDDHDIRDRMLKAGAVDLLDKCEPVSALVPTLHRLWDEHG